MTTNIQRAIDKQAELEAEATSGPWSAETNFGNGYVRMPCHKQAELYGSKGYSDAQLIAHLRNQAKLMREALAAADERISGAIDMGINPLYFEAYFNAAKAWADHVNGEEP